MLALVSRDLHVSAKTGVSCLSRVSWSFLITYDADNRLASRWSKAKGYTYYTNDAVGNLTYVNYPASHDITLKYDANNRLTNMIDTAGTTKFT